VQVPLIGGTKVVGRKLSQPRVERNRWIADVSWHFLDSFHKCFLYDVRRIDAAG
jgi:hypothetical protein